MTTIITSNEPREILNQIVKDLRARADVRAMEPTNEAGIAAAHALRMFAEGLEYPNTMTVAEHEKERAERAEIITRKLTERGFKNFTVI